jgi:hypothetical protein
MEKICLRYIATEGLVRTGCRGGTPSWGRSPHTPCLNHLNGCYRFKTLYKFDAVALLALSELRHD